VVSDSGVLNQTWREELVYNGLPGDNEDDCEAVDEDAEIERALERLAPEVSDKANEPHLLVGDGRLQVPIMHVWNLNDNNLCGNIPMPCGRPDDRLVPAARCNHLPMWLALSTAGAAAIGSRSLPVCVEGNQAFPCSRHVVTTMPERTISVDPGNQGPIEVFEGDYQAEILAWVHERRSDD
jgi:hypothetical protein